MNYEDYIKVYELERILEYRKWEKEIPFLQFDQDWEVKIIPHFGGVIARFLVKKGEAKVSIYLDCYDRLGCVGEPYWEVYPYDDDVYRCSINEANLLLNAISRSLKKQ